ncbi:TcfC E-set like domain-containing protein [Aeromonas veronii]
MLNFIGGKLKFFFSVFLFYSYNSLANAWFPEEFRQLMQSRFQMIDIYYGQQFLGAYEVEIRQGSVRLPLSYDVIEELIELEPSKHDALLHALDGWLSTNSNLQCYAQDIQRCAVLTSDRPSVILDEARLRLRLFLPKTFLKSGAKAQVKKERYLPAADKQGITAVQTLGFAMSADTQSQNYTLSGDTIISKGEYGLNGRWYQYDSLDGNQGFTIEQVALKHEKQGHYWAIGLIDERMSSAWNAFRAIPQAGVYGTSWGASSNTLQSRAENSATLLEVYMPAVGRVEIYRNGRLLVTQSVPVGNSLLDTQSFPYGAYEVELRGLVGSTAVFNERRLFVKSSWLPASDEDEFSFSLGVQKDAQVELKHLPLAAAGWSKRLTSSHAVKLGGFARQDLQRMEIGLLGVWPMNYNSSLVIDNIQYGSELSLSHSIDKLYGYMEGRFYKKNEITLGNSQFSLPNKTLTTGLSYQIGPNYSLSYRLNHNETEQWDSYNSAIKCTSTTSQNIDFNMTHPLWMNYSLNVNFGVGLINGGENQSHVNFSLGYFNQHQLMFNYNVQRHNSRTTHVSSLNATSSAYSSALFERVIYSLDASYSEKHQGVGAGIAFNSGRVEGNIMARHEGSPSSSNYDSYYGSLKTQIASDENGKLVWGLGDRKRNSGLIVDLSDGPDVGQLDLLIENKTHTVFSGRENWIPLLPYQSYTVRLRDHNNDDRLFSITGSASSHTLYPGNVVRVKYNIEEDEVLFGLLADSQGGSLTNALLMGRYPSRTDDSGQFEMRIPRSATQLMARIDKGQYCLVELPKRVADTSYQSVGILSCRVISPSQARFYASQSESNEWEMDKFSEQMFRADIQK